jgi:hypothetical protein
MTQALGVVLLRIAGMGPANAMPVVDIKNEFEEAALRVARLLGHALAAALGFCALGLISLIPIVVVRILLWLGLAELAGPLHMLEVALLFADIALSAVVLFAGIAVFAVEAVANAWRRMRMVSKETGHNE